MKKNLQRIVICFLFFIFCLEGKEAKGQWVTIPDAGFVAYLQNSFPSAMNGNQLDTTNMWVANLPSNINCSGYVISDFSGIQYFKLLGDFIYDSPNYIGIGVNVPELSTSVHKIKFYLPTAPQVYFQHLSSPNLTHLDLFMTSASFIPPLSSSLTYLGFHVGPGSVGLITPLPPNLLYLKCTGNFTTPLPALPNGLKGLDCSYMSNLASLPNLPPSLRRLNCTDCNISTLPTLPASLDTLECSYNNLSQLPVLPGSLKMLHCNNNNIVSLLAIPQLCKKIIANNNQLSSIGSLPDSIDYLNIQNNPTLNCLPELKKISSLNFTGTGIACIPNLGNVTNSNPPLLSLPFCDMFNANGCPFFWNINGKVFDDAINNCLLDSVEYLNKNIGVNLFENGNLIQQTFTNYKGEFIFEVDTGTYTYSIDTLNSPFTVICPAAQFNNSIITSTDSLDIDMNFGLQCKAGFDLGIYAIARVLGRFQPANFACINIKAGDMTNKYGLHCASGISGTVTVTINGPASYISAAIGSLTPSVNGDTLTYSIADFGAVNFDSDFSIIVQTDTTAIIGSSVCFDVVVAPTIGDNYSLNNSLQQCFNVVGSFDPNEKEVYPINRVDDTNGKLIYTITFQNTGNAPAEHIYILDTLDAALDESSFELLAYSHQLQLQVIGNVVRFNFPNINLPDSVNDEPNSHGYVQYRVKLKDSLALGTVISNTSYIYFDFNPPVQTNTVVDTLTDCNNLAAIDVVNPSLCTGDTLILNAALAYPATTDWYVDSVFVSSNQNISIPNLSTGNHEIKLVVTNAYCNTEVVSYVVMHGLPLVDLGNDSSTCNIPVLLLAGFGNISYLWSNGATTPIVIANSTANYSVIVTDIHGCSNTDDVNIIVNPVPSVELGNDSSTCNLPVTLDAGAGSIFYLWSSGETTQTIVANTTANYSVIVTDTNGCSNTDSVNVIVNPLPIVALGNDTSTCNIPVTLDAGTGSISYLWSSGETTQTIIANTTANYSVIVIDNNGCSITDSISIVINALPVKPTITQNISLLTSSSSTGNQWLMNGNVIAGATNTTYNVTLTGWYSVMVTDSNGCSNLSDSIYMDLTGVSDVSGSNGLIRIVPNPATDEFRVSGFDTSAGSVWQFGVGDIVTISDALGNVVYEIKVTQPTSNLKLGTSNYKSGVYFVSIITSHGAVTLKLIIM